MTAVRFERQASMLGEVGNCQASSEQGRRSVVFGEVGGQAQGQDFEA
jgi:hypothetical protein